MRKFPATIRTASNKKTTDSVIPSTWREGTEYGVYEEDLLFALVPADTFIIFLYEVRGGGGGDSHMKQLLP